ncbi:MAG: hypothetical protein IAE92_05740 [Burkholderiaceae bacterium]|nr:hypothetical protein [Burkholderiaceae bacterium]
MSQPSTPHGEDNTPQPFSLAQGGPCHRLLCRLRLSDENLGLLRRRIAFFTLLCWLPLLLTTLEGTLLDKGSTINFLQDLEVNARFLVCLPLLLWAERFMHQHMRSVTHEFVECELVPERALARFHRCVQSVLQWRDSAWPELVIVAAVYGIGVFVVWNHLLALDTPTWYARPGAGGLSFTLAGQWYSYVSIPVFQFFLCRWIWRLLIWARFLWQVSRIRLSLIPTHPDRVGGLGFLNITLHAFLPFALASGALLAGHLADEVLFQGVALMTFRFGILLMLATMLVLLVGPFLFFGQQLYQARRAGIREYGVLAHNYTRNFEAKWLRSGGRLDKPFLGSEDVRSLADLGSSVDVVDGMRLIPVTRESILLVMLSSIAPLAPLLASAIPTDSLIDRLVGLMF